MCRDRRPQSGLYSTAPCSQNDILEWHPRARTLRFSQCDAHSASGPHTHSESEGYEKGLHFCDFFLPRALCSTILRVLHESRGAGRGFWLSESSWGASCIGASSKPEEVIRQCSQAVIGWVGILSSCFVSPRSSTAAAPALSAGQMAPAFTCLDSAGKRRRSQDLQ